MYELQSRSKQMKNLSPPSPHFNDEKKSAFWFAREFIIDMGGGGFYFSFYSVQDCSSLFLLLLLFYCYFDWTFNTLQRLFTAKSLPGLVACYLVYFQVNMSTECERCAVFTDK